MSPLVIALIGLIVWIGLSVGLGFLLGLKDATLYIFIGLLSIVGIIGAGFFVWWKNKQDAASGAKPSGDPEIDQLVKEVDAKLAAAKAVAGAKIGNLPLFFVMGEPGSVKTTSSSSPPSNRNSSAARSTRKPTSFRRAWPTSSSPRIRSFSMPAAR